MNDTIKATLVGVVFISAITAIILAADTPLWPITVIAGIGLLLVLAWVLGDTFLDIWRNR